MQKVIDELRRNLTMRGSVIKFINGDVAAAILGDEKTYADYSRTFAAEYFRDCEIAIKILEQHMADQIIRFPGSATPLGKLSDKGQNALEHLGNFVSTVNEAERTVKGQGVDDCGDVGQVYYTSDELRLLSEGLRDAADWLDERALLATASA
jgi:hypothetical protein